MEPFDFLTAIESALADIPEADDFPRRVNCDADGEEGTLVLVLTVDGIERTYRVHFSRV